MPVGGGLSGPSKGVSINIPKKGLDFKKDKCKFGISSSNVKSKNFGVAKPTGPLADPVDPPHIKYCMGCGATNVLIDEDINL